MSSRGIQSLPKEWMRHIAMLTRPVELAAAGYPTTAQPTADQIIGLYFPLLHALEQQGQARDVRILAGMAGIPGSGKSTVAALLKHVADCVLGENYLVVVGMDGWHWPNAVLDARTTRDQAGQEIPLRLRKGGPESFDVEAMIRSLHMLRDEKNDTALPVYDRRLHEPVADGLIVPADTRIVLVEGNYLLSRTPPWDCVSALLSPKLFLACDADIARQRTIARHVRGGISEQEAADKHEMNDRLNADIILHDASNADWVMTLDPEPGLKRTRDETV